MEVAHREEFLRLLSRELPESIYCELCNVIHRGDMPFKTRGGVLSPCFKHDDIPEMSTSIHVGFRFIFFQMLMKRHALGLDTTSYINRLCFRYIDQEQTNLPTEFTSEARIVKGRFSRSYIECADEEFVHLGRPAQLSSGQGDICRSFEQKEPGHFDSTLSSERISNLTKFVNLSYPSMKDYTLVEREGHTYLERKMSKKKLNSSGWMDKHHKEN
jgi:hypothetical protein